MFVRSGTAWTLQANLVASGGSTGDRFGSSVALDGNTLIVGAEWDDAGDLSDGSGYVFARSGTTWTERAHLMANDGGNSDHFGHSVALNGDTAAIGVDRHDTFTVTNAGSVYVFVRSGSIWMQQAFLNATDAAEGDRFGSSVAIAGDTLVVGGRLHDTQAGKDAGSAYVFVRSGSDWTWDDTLKAPDADDFDQFGSAVRVDGDTVMVGVFLDDLLVGRDAGSARVFVGSGTTWIQQARLTPLPSPSNRCAGG